MPAIATKSKEPALLQDMNALTAIILLNILAFVAVNFIHIVYYILELPPEAFFTQFLNWVALPAPLSEFITRPWTLFTFFITQLSIWQLLSNMAWFWVFGNVFRDLCGNARVAPVYIYGGLAGGVIFLLTAANGVAFVSPLLGAGVCVVAMAAAATAVAPDYRFFPLLGGGIPLWILTLVFLVVDYASVASANRAILLAHVAGAITGFFFVKRLQSGSDPGAWMHRMISRVDDLFNPEKNSPDRAGRQFYRGEQPAFRKKSHPTQGQVDALLDKIHQHGYGSLTKEEKEFLEKASKQP